jgi:uncharacterized protein YdaU (DUF1376 family)
MHYYEHHIKDYAAATAHLSWDEDMAYTRMIRRYYKTETPLPADIAEACRVVGAKTRAQKEAVEAVLREFFELQGDGWHQTVCDTVIARFKAGQPERDAKKVNEQTRLERHRAERAELFAVINAAGHHLPYNAPIAEVRALANKVRTADPATRFSVSGAVSAETPATAPATPATATQEPTTNNHYPNNPSGGVPAAPTPGPAGQGSLVDPPPPAPTPRPAKPAKTPKPPAEPKPTNAAWAAYAEAFIERYSVEPERNQAVNGQLATLIGKVKAEDVPAVIAFYVRRCTNAYYLQRHHPIDAFCRDYHGIRTLWMQQQQGLAPAAPAATPPSPRAQALAGFAGHAAAGAARPNPARPRGDVTDVEPRDVRLGNR